MGQQEAGPARAGLFVFGVWGIAVLGLALCARCLSFTAGCEVDRGMCASWLNALAQETQPDEPGEARGITKSLPRAGVFLLRSLKCICIASSL